jgi:hypothetical protein
MLVCELMVHTEDDMKKPPVKNRNEYLAFLMYMHIYTVQLVQHVICISWYQHRRMLKSVKYGKRDPPIIA